MADKITRIAIVDSNRCKPKRCAQECKKVLGLVGTNGIGKSTALKILAGKLKPNLGRYDDPPDWQEILKYFRGSELQNYFTKVLEDNLKALIKPQYVDHIPKAIKGNLTVSQMLDSKLELDNKQKMCDELELNHVLDRDVSHLSGGELQRFAIAMSCIQKADVYMFDEPSSYLDIKQRLKAAEVIRSLLTPDCYVVAVEHDLSVLDYLSDFICCLYGKPSMYGVVTMPYSVREGINIFLDGFIPTENLRFREESLSFKMVENAEELLVDKTRHYSYPAMTKTLGNFKLTVEAGSFTDSEIIVMLGENGTGKTTFVRLLAGDTPDVETDKVSLSVSLKPQTISPKFPGTVRMLLLKQIKAAFMHPQFQTDVLKPMNLDNIMDQEVKTLSGGELQRVAIVLALGAFWFFIFAQPLRFSEILSLLPASIVMVMWGGRDEAGVGCRHGLSPYIHLGISPPSSIITISLSASPIFFFLLLFAPGVAWVIRADAKFEFLLQQANRAPFLDSEQRIIASKVIKRFILHSKKTAFVIEHDFIMATYLADRVIVFEGQPARHATATPPQSLLSGMNRFLASLEITFRRDPTNFRPRVNKLNSIKDREQKAAGNYFFLED
ncbi:hypothetical protein CVT26_010216 [Gymnopilus dilepis]|uniref:ABC transporter domain-containing protein n=1 Tax=Gymnopilus dilepis TaxID=231916 RepID=A0A409Y1A3_9AGAR|nr:hypothetical protein CVT26_010216 [Gymnopilus dilepis]